MSLFALGFGDSVVHDIIWIGSSEQLLLYIFHFLRNPLTSALYIPILDYRLSGLMDAKSKRIITFQRHSGAKSKFPL